MRHHSGDPVAEVQGVAAVEVHDVADLQRERVARVARQHAIDRRAGVMPAAVDQALGRGDEAPLAIVRAGRMPAGRIQRLHHHRYELAFGQRIEHECLQEMPGNKSGRRLQPLVDGGDRIADVALELLERALVARQCESVRAGDRNAA